MTHTRATQVKVTGMASPALKIAGLVEVGVGVGEAFAENTGTVAAPSVGNEIDGQLVRMPFDFHRFW